VALQEAAGQAKEHGIREVTPELIERVKANIRDAWKKVLSVVSTHGAVSKGSVPTDWPAMGWKFSSCA
jgi:hypothetical protein